MAINDKKIEKLLERAGQLEQRIKNDTPKRKHILAEVERLSYANFKTEMAKNDMTTDDYVVFIRMKKKMADKNMSVEDVEEMLDSLSEKMEETEDEKTIF